jgi:hypothetical protein
MKSRLKKAKYNEDFLTKFEELLPNDYFDWKITVVFYIAVHYIDAYFLSHGTGINSHESRRNTMEHHHSALSEDCIDNYDNLYRLARNARYNGFLGLKEWTKHQRDCLKEAKKNLSVIRKEITDDLDQIAD